MILDRKKTLFAYELLFRDGLSNFFPKVDSDTATSKLLSSSFFTIGIERITGGKRAFINFTQNLLVTEVPSMFPPASTVVEILEDVKPDQAVIESCRKLSKAGYFLALDDFVLKPGLEALIKLADIIKIDFRLSPMDEIKKLVSNPDFKLKKFLAEKIETTEEFMAALNMGFEYFQGYFFSQPEIIKGRELTTSTVQLLNLVVELNKPDVNMDEIQKIVEHDVSISYKLLRYVNSAFMKRRAEISSIRKALMIIGLVELKRLVSLILLSKVSVGKPDELIRSSCIEARFCEKLGHISTCVTTKDELFMLGLFAHLDAILDQPMNEILEKISLSKPISDALVLGEGEAVKYLRLAQSYEKGEWDNVKEYVAQTCVPGDAVPDIYMEACKWADEFAA